MPKPALLDYETAEALAAEYLATSSNLGLIHEGDIISVDEDEAGEPVVTVERKLN